MIRTVRYSIFLFSLVSGCFPGWQPFNNSCYHLSMEAESWMDGMRMCQMHGGYLVHIDTVEEDNFIAQLMKTNGLSIIWMGGSDWTMEGTWVWEPEGQPFQYDNFARAYGKPNNKHGENCLSMEKYYNFQWDDDDCDDLEQYVCEKQNIDLTFG